MRKFYWIIVFLLGTLSLQAQFNTDRITAIGRNALYFDDYVLSIQYFNQVIKLKPYLSEPYLLRAIAKYQLGDHVGARQDCDAAIERNPFQPGAYYTRGFIYMQLGFDSLAEHDLSEALRFAPENRTYLLLRADIRAQLEQYDLAMADIRRLLRREPNSPTLLFEQGVINLKQNDTISALNSFQQATEYDTQNPANWSALGLVHLMLNHEQEALTALSQSINQGSKWAGDYINRGILYHRLHNYRSALADLDKATSLSPNEAQCYFNRGMIRQELGDYNRAVEDYNRAIDLAPEQVEMCYQRGMLLLQLKQWDDALNDFSTLMNRFPYFLPAYYLSAQAHSALGHDKQAFDLRQKAADLELHKDSIRAQAVKTDPQLAQSQPPKKDYRKQFSAMAAQNQEAEDTEQQYASASRGSVQKHYTDVVNEPNMVLSYYANLQDPATSLRRTNYSHASVDAYNRLQWLPAPLRFTTQELPLSAEMISRHFAAISTLSDRIDVLEQYIANGSNLHDQLSAALLARAMEFALVQDYSSAIDDATRATLLDDKLYFAYFCRANWRYKLLEYKRAMGEKTESADFELMLRDYDFVIHHVPDFSFAYYNRANMLCIQQDFQAAIRYYTQAIAQDADFAEAYFNRGLTHLYIGNHDEGIRDLSKAGELGIYQAYNLISRFQ